MLYYKGIHSSGVSSSGLLNLVWDIGYNPYMATMRNRAPRLSQGEQTKGRLISLSYHNEDVYEVPGFLQYRTLI